MNESTNLLLLTFITNQSGEITKALQTPERISSASTRIQMVPLIKAANNIGFESSTWSLHSKNPEDLKQIKKLVSVRALIIGKMSTDSVKHQQSMIMANTAAISHFKSIKTPIILLYSDNHLAREDDTGSFYKQLIFYADTVVVPSESLKSQIDAYTNKSIPCFVINDPLQTKAQPISFKKTESIKKSVNLIWFGQGRNADYLIDILPRIINECSISTHYNLKILTRKNVIQYISKTIKNNNYNSKKRWNIEFISWDDANQPKQFQDALANAHLSIIPSDSKDPTKLGVSHNRLIDSVQSGCITIASPLKSYLELSTVSILGENFSQMIDFAITNYQYLCDKFESERQSALSNFSPSINIKNWETLLRSLLQ